ncbi:MAG TPA: 2-oxo-4-hydroxy-4-carboxy-5-ureidoimidazoline decarboxylase [Steroidobacteraceae bacterium]
MISLQELNSCAGPQFVAALSGVFERSAWVAERVVAGRPFRSQLHLHEALCAAIGRASPDEQLALIRAHPELVGRAAIHADLTCESAREQQSAGLAACSPQEFGRLQQLNAAYLRKFGFPFVLAVKGHDRTSVLAALEQRLPNTIEHERAVALREIGRIAGFRLAELVDEPLGTRIIAMAEQLARISDRNDGLACSYLTPAHRATAALIRDFMLAAGLTVETDAVGNVIGRWPSVAGATLLTGSHYDTVTDAGKFDGRLGILLPLAVVARLRHADTSLPFTLTVIAFAEEEGVRFKSSFLGSRAVAGRFDPSVLESVDADGITMRQAMISCGLDPAAISRAAFDPRTLIGFVEVHIEQGPVLLGAGAALGVVTSIAGSTRCLVTVTGLAGHAGTVPMPVRRDAAAAAAEVVLAVERCCSDTPGLVGTVGELHVPGGATNVIPGRCELSVDIRADNDEVRNAAVARVMAESERIAARRQVDIQWRTVLEVASVRCAPAMQQRWADSIGRVTGRSDVRRLPSGAGHDAMVMAHSTQIGMLFVRCGNGGISHHPSETMSAADADLAARAFEDFLVHFLAADVPDTTMSRPQ